MKDLGVKSDAFSISYDYTFEGRPRLAMEGIQFDMSSMDRPKGKTLPQANPSGEMNTVRMEFVRKSEQPENGFLRYENTLFFNGERIGKRVEYIKPEEVGPHLSLVVVEGQFWFDNVVVREMKKVER